MQNIHSICCTFIPIKNHSALIDISCEMKPNFSSWSTIGRNKLIIIKHSTRTHSISIHRRVLQNYTDALQKVAMTFVADKIGYHGSGKCWSRRGIHIMSTKEICSPSSPQDIDYTYERVTREKLVAIANAIKKLMMDRVDFLVRAWPLWWAQILGCSCEFNENDFIWLWFVVEGWGMIFNRLRSAGCHLPFLTHLKLNGSHLDSLRWLYFCMGLMQ